MTGPEAALACVQWVCCSLLLWRFCGWLTHEDRGWM
jgi:hypothetical protein